ncbi:glycosyltransferase [Geobacter sp. FeAm09]|uniref:glycosyltransferase n=1 Tax=Geobacter sp. FeAm09 TaxID=2597769 RepID=UPI0011ED59D7|nr:glycosyltransferase [Geobacter sp. FeAm09]QEM69755.1 glycosyltransferase [Geobacter sp. FeAm09]
MNAPRPHSAAPAVSIVIPVHNQLHFTRQCLASLEKGTEPGLFEVVVIDDASHDGTEEALRALADATPWLRYFRNSVNRGFAASCNQGAVLAQGDYLLFLNNDTMVTAGWLSTLVAVLESRPDVGIVGPKLVFPDDTIQHCGKVWGDHLAPRSNPDHLYYREPADAAHVNRSRDYQAITGACMLLRRAEFFRYGPFDEQYENGWEDDDLCYAYREQGLRIHYCAAATVVHFQSISLNDGLSQEERLLKELSGQAAAGAPPDPRLPGLYQKVEQRLLGIRARFERNRSRFFDKWGRRVFRDDYRYFQADGLEERFLDVGRRPLPLVSIIILTINQLPYTMECVASIQRHTREPYELIFIDNGSTDGTVPWLRALAAREPDTCRVIENSANLGFAKGCNQGLEAAQGDYLLLLNNDVVVTEGWLSGLLDCFRHRPETGIVGPLTNNISGIQRLPGAPPAPRDGIDEFAAALRARFAGRRIYNRRIVGFCMLFTRDLLNRVGYLDDSFGNGNFEDDDYCLRAELEGFRNLIAGDVFIHHYGSVSFRGNNLDYAQSMAGNRGVFNRKWNRTITEPALARKVVTLKTLEEAERLRRLGRSNAAVEVLLKDGIAQIPGEMFFYCTIAAILLEGGMAAEALQTLRPAPRLDETPWALYLLAQAAGLLAQEGVARDAARRAGRCHPAYPHLHLIRGVIALRHGEPALAAEAFGAAAAMDPSSPDAFCGLAQAAEAANDRGAAFEWYRRACIVDPACLEAARGLHRHAAGPGEQALARGLFEEALHFRDDDRDLRYLLIDLLIKAGDLPAALAHAERAMVLFGADPGLVNAALALRRPLGPLVIPLEAAARGTSVSLCMIAKNEARDLPRCLASLKPVVDEIVLCDTGSSDGTREIAEAFGARVVGHAWTGDFSAARNCALAAATGAWILVMDADEVISPLDYEALRDLVGRPRDGMVAYTITTRNYTNKLVEKWQEQDGRYPAEEAGRGWLPSDKVRLFPNRPEIRFENAIHEMVEPTLERLKIPCPTATRVVVHHYGYLDDKRQDQKKALYYEIGVKKLAESGGSPKAIVELAIQAAGIERYEEAIELWQRALPYNPESALAYFNLGYANLCLGRYDEAYRATKRSLELQGDYREAVANLALIEVFRGRHQAALHLLDERQAADRDDYVMFDLVRAVACCCNHEPERGEGCFRSVVERHVEFGTFVETAARHLRQAGRGADAAAVVGAAGKAGCRLGGGS